MLFNWSEPPITLLWCQEFILWSVCVMGIFPHHSYVALTTGREQLLIFLWSKEPLCMLHMQSAFFCVMCCAQWSNCLSNWRWSTAYRYVARMMTALFYSSALSSEFDKHELFLLACFVLQIALNCTVSIWEEIQKGDILVTQFCEKVNACNIHLGLHPIT